MAGRLNINAYIYIYIKQSQRGVYNIILYHCINMVRSINLSFFFCHFFGYVGLKTFGKVKKVREKKDIYIYNESKKLE